MALQQIGLLPERVEGGIERSEIVVSMHQERPEGPVDVVARGDVDVRQRVDDVEQPPHVHLESTTAEDPAKGNQIVDDSHERCGCQPPPGTRLAGRSIRPASPCVRSNSRSSFAFTTTPSVWSNASA